MTLPRSTPGNPYNNSMDELGDTSSMDDLNTTLSPQASQDAVNEGDNFVEMLRNMPPDTSGRFSLIHSDSQSSDRSDVLVDDHDDDNSVSIEPKLYRVLINGNKEEIVRMGVNLWETKCREDKNSVLHIAASAGNAQLITEILPLCKDIIKWKNMNGDLAFHCAAKAAQLEGLKALLDWNVYSADASVSGTVLMEGNDEGDTALHIALENNQENMAECLFEKCPEACYELNGKKVCPLYLGIKSGYWGLVKDMIDYTNQQKPAAEKALIQAKSVIHAIIDAQNIEILEKVLGNHETLIELLDDKLTPLSYAAFKGYLCGVQFLLGKFPDSAFKCNDDGSFPIHKAVSGGHVKVVKELILTRQLLNREGQNILHVAAASGKAKVLSYLMSLQDLSKLINLKDDDGNTPLHLATKGFHPRVVYILTRDKRVKLHIQNKHGLTAQDVADTSAGSTPSFEERLTWMALRYVDAPQSSLSTRKSYVQNSKQSPEQESPKYYSRKPNKKANDRSDLESFKARVDTHLLVATLVATVTFAAGFTAPGGYKQGETGIGMAVLAHKWAFQMFVICNTAALYSSVLSVVTLIWAHIGDLKLILVSLKFALPLLGFALSMMSLAFMMGIFVVLRDLPWLSYVVLGMGSVSMLFILAIFIPLYSPSYIRNPVVRFFFSGTFLLLLLVCEKSTSSYA